MIKPSFMKANTSEISEAEQPEQSKQQDKYFAHSSVIDLIENLSKTTLSNMFSDELESLEYQINVTHQINHVMTSHINAANTCLNSMQNTFNILL